MVANTDSGWRLRAACAVLAIALAGCSKPPEMPPFPPPGVTVAHPVAKPFIETRRGTGRLEPVERVEVRARVKGYLQKIHFTEGAEVKAGDLLYEIDPATFRAELTRAEAEVKRLAASFDLAEREAARAIKLKGQRAASEEDVSQKLSARDVAEAAMNQAKAAVETYRLELGFTKVTAPISGRIGRTLVTVGNLVGAGMEPTLLTTIVRMDPLYLYFEAPERDVAAYDRLLQVATGDRPPLRFALDTDKGKAFPHRAEVDMRENEIDRGSATILLRARLANPQRLFTPGRFVRIEVPLGAPREVLAIPEDALGTDQRGKYVLVVDEKELAQRRSIAVLGIEGGWAFLESGLKATDRVMVNGQAKARPGAPVTVVEGPGAKPMPGGPPAAPAGHGGKEAAE